MMYSQNGKNGRMRHGRMGATAMHGHSMAHLDIWLPDAGASLEGLKVRVLQLLQHKVAGTHLIS